MFCAKCGAPLGQGARFCSACGAAQEYAAGTIPPVGFRPAIMRPRYGRKIAGVCAALARHFNVDVTLVRVIAVVLLLLWGGGLLAYIVGWIAIPEEPFALPPEVPPTSV